MKSWLLLLSLLVSGVAGAGNALPGDSIYHLPVTLTTQAGETQPLVERRGQVQIVTMLYTSCQLVCPMIIDGMRQTYKALPDAVQNEVALLAVSFDPERDDVARLGEYAEKRKLEAPRWTLARAPANEVRQLSSVLGLQYRQLPDGEYNHSSELILLDREGRIVARTSKLGRLDASFVEAIKQTVEAGS